MSTEITKRPLPSLQELHHDPEQAFKNDELNLLLYQEVPPNWLKVHPFITLSDEFEGRQISVPYKYIPIEKIEFLLTRIFQRWEVQVIDTKTMFNAVAVHVRLKVMNPVDGSWITQDGLGAVDVQTKKGASAADLSMINANAVMKALPAAESYAIKDAAEKLGRLFGKDLNKKDLTPFSGSYMKEDIKQETAKQARTAYE